MGHGCELCSSLMAVGHRVCGQPYSPASASAEAGKGAARLRRQGWDGVGPAAARGEGDVRGRCDAWLVHYSWCQAGSRAVRLGRRDGDAVLDVGRRGEHRRWDGSGSGEQGDEHPGCACPRDARGCTAGWAVREQGEGGRKEKKGNGGRKEKRKGERGKRERERRSAGFAATSTTRGGRTTRSATRGTRNICRSSWFMHE